MSDEMLTIKQAAALINLEVSTLYSKVHKRQIPVCKQGGRLYFSKMELTDWLKSGRKKTTAEIASEAQKHIKSTK
jgi:excisionase family DNA binding protein